MLYGTAFQKRYSEMFFFSKRLPIPGTTSLYGTPPLHNAFFGLQIYDYGIHFTGYELPISEVIPCTGQSAQGSVVGAWCR